MKLKSILLGCAAFLAAAPASAAYLGAQTIWQFDHSNNVSGIGARTSEIVAFDALSSEIYVSGGAGVDVLSSTGSLLRGLGGTPAGSDYVPTDITSVSVKNGIVAMAGRFAPADSASGLPAYGGVRFYTTGGAFLRDVRVTTDSDQNLPDTTAFTPDGSRLIVANEGETGNGSVGIIDVGSYNVQLLGFDAFEGSRAALKSKGVLLNDAQSLNAQLQPEYVAISKDGTKAFVTLQEQNGVAVVDLVNNVITEIQGMGFVDRSVVKFDPSDRDGGGNTRTFANVVSTIEPDQVVWFTQGGQKFYAVAGEGDDGIALASGYVPVTSAGQLDPAKFPDAATLLQNANLGRIAKFGKDTDGDGDVDQIYVTGGRSVSIFKEDGTLVWNSGSLIEDTLIAQGGGFFADGRSDNRGPEPEGIVFGMVDAKPYLFVSIERGSSVLMLGIDDVNNPVLADFLATDFTPGFARLSETEGMAFIGADESWDGQAYLAITSELSNMTSLMRLVVPEPAALGVLGVGLAGFAAARRRRCKR